MATAGLYSLPVIKIGDIEIRLISDGQIMADAGGAFGLVPRPLYAPIIQPDDQNRIPMEHRSMLIRAGGKTILVETGLGTKLNEKTKKLMGLTRPNGGLVEGLARHGMQPEDIDLVINTHLHSDHCGGNTYFEGDELKPTFPNAEYWVQRLEYADAALPNERTRGTYFAHNFVPLYESGQMRLLDGDVEVVPGIRCAVTPGHTRAHQSIIFEQENAFAFYPSDLSTMAVQFARLAWMTAYDVEPLVTLETKRNWQRWVLERDALLLFVHDPLMAAGKLVEKDGRLNITAAEF